MKHLILMLGPYVAPEFEVNENIPPDLLTISGMKKVEELEHINMQLKRKWKNWKSHWRHRTSF